MVKKNNVPETAAVKKARENMKAARRDLRKAEKEAREKEVAAVKAATREVGAFIAERAETKSSEDVELLLSVMTDDLVAGIIEAYRDAEAAREVDHENAEDNVDGVEKVDHDEEGSDDQKSTNLSESSNLENGKVSEFDAEFGLAEASSMERSSLFDSN